MRVAGLASREALRPVLATLGLAWGLACTEPGSTPDAGPAGDASAPTPRALPPARPEVPQLRVAEPVLGPCPQGWADEPALGRSERTCTPWPAGPPECGRLEAKVPGVGCVRLGTSCPADGWPEGLPQAVKRWVRPGASGDGGTRGTATGSIQSAMESAGRGGIVVLAAGRYTERVVPWPGTTLWGACPEQTVLSLEEALDDSAVVHVAIEGVTVKNLSIVGGNTRAVLVSAAGALRLEDVLIEDVPGAGVLAVDAARADVERVAVRRVRAEPFFGSGLYAGRGGSITARQVELQGFAEAGAIAVSGYLTLEDVYIRWLGELSTLLEVRGQGVSVHVAGNPETLPREAGATVRRVVVEDAGDGALVASKPGASIRAEDVVVQRVVGAGQPRTGTALAALEGAEISARRVLTHGAALAAVWAQDEGRVLLEDFYAFYPAPDPVVSTNGGRCFDARRGFVRATRALCVGAFDAGAFSVGRTGRLSLTDVGIYDTVGTAEDVSTSTAGDGVHVQESSTATLTRVHVARVRRAGVLVDGATLEARDLWVEDVAVEGASGQLGAGLAATDGAAVRVQGARFSRNRTYSVLSQSDATIELTDALIEDTAIGGTEPYPYDVGLVVVGGRLAASRVEVANSGLFGVAISNSSSATVADLWVHDHHENGAGFGDGVLVEGDSTLKAERVRVERVRGRGVSVVRSAASFTDLMINQMRESPGAERAGFGAAAYRLGLLTLERADITDALGLGVVAERAEVDARGVTISDVRPLGEGAAFQLGGSGLASLRSGVLRAQDFVVEGAAYAAALVAEGSRMEFESGLIRRCYVGISAERPVADVLLRGTALEPCDFRNVDSGFPTPPELEVPGLGGQ